MSKFDPETVAAMRSVLEEVCSHIPARSTAARSFVAAKILECASNGNQSHDLLLDAGRRAVIDQFGSYGPNKPVAPGATSAILDNSTVPAFTLTNPPSRSLKFNYRMTDTSVKSAVYQYN